MSAQLTWLDRYFAAVAPIVQAMPALDVDFSAADVFTKTLAAGANAITFSNMIEGKPILVVFTGASSTVDWSGVPGLKWPGGTVPTQTASGLDAYTFVKVGANVLGSVLQNFS